MPKLLRCKSSDCQPDIAGGVPALLFYGIADYDSLVIPLCENGIESMQVNRVKERYRGDSGLDYGEMCSRNEPEECWLIASKG